MMSSTSILSTSLGPNVLHETCFGVLVGTMMCKACRIIKRFWMGSWLWMKIWRLVRVRGASLHMI